MSASWAGLRHVEALDVEQYRRRRGRPLVAGRLFLALFGLMSIGMLAWVALSPPTERGSSSWMSPLCGLLLASIYSWTQLLEHRRVNGMTSLVRTIALEGNKVTVETVDNFGEIASQSSEYYWTYLRAVRESDVGIELWFEGGKRVPTLVVPLSVFPDAETNAAFVSFAKREAARCGKRPKESWLHVPGD